MLSYFPNPNTTTHNTSALFGLITVPNPPFSTPTLKTDPFISQSQSWEVVYSTAPAPSNGALGPFRGVAFQDIDMKTGTYLNRLELPYDVIGASLRARWECMGNDDSLWRVEFDDVTVSFFGNKLFSKTFADVERVWDVTFLDRDTRVVRAARTLQGLRKEQARGRVANAGEEDDCVFVMTRVT